MLPPERAHALAILQAGIAAADPGAAVRRHLRIEHDELRCGNDIALPRAGIRHLHLIAVGKAASTMTTAALEKLGEMCTTCTVTVPRGSARHPADLDPWEGEHPLPGMGGMAGAAEALRVAREAEEGDLILCLLSGGASALWPAPAGNLTLDDLRDATRSLLRSGAPIDVVNGIRKHLSRIAGGGLAAASRPARVLTLAVRDVIGVSDAAIGSGPTLPDLTTYSEVLNRADEYRVELPGVVRHHLRTGAAGMLPETPKPAELDNLAGFFVALDIGDALDGAAVEARRLGYRVELRSAEQEGEAREVGASIAEEALRVRDAGGGPAVLLWGGETTVTVSGDGIGGRNQEIAVAAAVRLAGEGGVVVASVGTDGRDGPTEAAGGMVDGGTVGRGVAVGKDPSAHLARNDSYPYLQATGDLIVTGQTGTNVNDLMLAVVTGDQA